MRTFVQVMEHIRIDAARYAGGKTGSLASLLLSSPPLRLTAIYRIRFWLAVGSGKRLPAIIRHAAQIMFFMMNYCCVLNTRIHIQGRLEIGPGLKLPREGCVILGGQRYGAGLTVGKNVTVGQLGDAEHVPEIGDDVVIGDGCLIFGKVRLGDGAVIEPGTILSKSVPDDGRAGGNPGRVLRGASERRPTVTEGAATC